MYSRQEKIKFTKVPIFVENEKLFEQARLHHSIREINDSIVYMKQNVIGH